MNPSDANSVLATLRQLKEMLDAGALTPQEFEALKQKLLFNQGVTTPSAEPPVTEPTLGQSASAVAPKMHLPVETAQVDLPPASATPEGTDWLTVAAPVLLENPPTDPLIEAPEERRNPLTLVLVIGGALVLLALVLYLTIGGTNPDEHLTSTSQTATDTTATAPEVGPQAEQLTLPPAVPETIRVARPVAVPMATPAPAATEFRADSVDAPVTSAPATSAAPVPVKPTSKPAPTPAVTADTAI